MSTRHGSLSRQASVRLQGGDLILQGFDNEAIMEIHEVSLSSVQRWREKVESERLAALARKPGSGSEAELSPEQFDELTTILDKGAIASGYQTERWTCRIVADLIRKQWNVDDCRSNVRRILNDLGYSYHGAETYFSERHRDWFEFEYLPTHSPELNPVESCWNKMKNEYLSNFVPTSDEELGSAVYAAAMKINEEKKILACFNTAGNKT